MKTSFHFQFFRLSSPECEVFPILFIFRAWLCFDIWMVFGISPKKERDLKLQYCAGMNLLNIIF